MTNRTSQILLVVVLVGKSNSGHVSSSPASVLFLYGVSLIHLLVKILNYWSVIGTGTKNFPYFWQQFLLRHQKQEPQVLPSSAKIQSLMKTTTKTNSAKYHNLLSVFKVDCCKCAQRRRQVERCWWKKVIRQRLSPSKKPGATLPSLSFPSSLGLPPSI